MTKNELDNAYFEWMYQLVCNRRYRSRRSYRKLLMYLHTVDYEYNLSMDENRAIDGRDLRYRFGHECGYGDSTISQFLGHQVCSVLEMMVALSLRCEETIMNDPAIGDRLGQWFWGMIDNLGLSQLRDTRFDKDDAETTVARFLNQKYDQNGRGGLFTLRHCNKDLRSVEIWYQMCWYLDENYN